MAMITNFLLEHTSKRNMLALIEQNYSRVNSCCLDANLTFNYSLYLVTKLISNVIIISLYAKKILKNNFLELLEA